MHLVNDKHLVFAHLWWYSYLVYELTNVIYRVVRCGIKLVDIKRALFVKSLARLTLIACLTICIGLQAVYGLRKDTSASSFTHTSWTTKQISMSQMPRTDGILQCCSQRRLSHNRIKRCRAVLSRRNNIVFHLLEYVVC